MRRGGFSGVAAMCGSSSQTFVFLFVSQSSLSMSMFEFCCGSVLVCGYIYIWYILERFPKKKKILVPTKHHDDFLGAQALDCRLAFPPLPGTQHWSLGAARGTRWMATGDSHTGRVFTRVIFGQGSWWKTWFCCRFTRVYPLFIP